MKSIDEQTGLNRFNPQKTQALKDRLNEVSNTTSKEIAKLDVDELLSQMLEHIGVVDAELRDNLIYSAFARLVDENILTSPQLEHLLAVSIDDQHLFYRMGEEGTDSVFTRTFSALSACLVLEKDREQSSLPHDLVASAINRSMLYLHNEEDTRGFVVGKGWAHSIAHGADLLTAAIKHPSFIGHSYLEYLEVISVCLLNKATVYMDNEEDRLICAIEALLGQGMGDSLLVQWIEDLNSRLKKKVAEGRSLVNYHVRTTTVHFFQALYFRLLFMQAGSDSRKVIETILEEWHKRTFA
ncbi:MAG: DUF2785 domain-containing protein [Gorillibacterium sp.]|nr:DUF2785 domain-containing protein [Gorillibacterium sp.]